MEAEARTQESGISSLPRFFYHVFLSFRGEDTRKNFTDHLYNALINAGIRTFRDDDEIGRGENIDAELRRGIRESRISIIVFSKDYASSRWCLDELLTILGRRKSEGHDVFPIFYSVGREDVEKQSGSFAEAFERHAKREKMEVEEGRVEWKGKVEKWREALREVAGLQGMVLQEECDGHEAEFIQKIIREIVKKLNLTVVSVPSYTVGLASRVRKINEWLQDESSDVGIGVICGLGGVGKTTVAKVAYNLNYDRFEGSSFLANVRKASEIPNGLVGLQKQIFENILKGREEIIFNTDEGIIKIKDAIGNKKVFIVFDDVDQLELLDVLIGARDWFSRGSKIIITTRCENLLKGHERHLQYKIKELDDEESLKLFSRYAFGQDHPLEHLMEYSVKAICHCGGLPLALKDLGSYLSGRSMDVWRSKLAKLETILHHKIQRNLEISLNPLDDYDKRLFILIACHFVGKDRDFAINILEKCDLHPVVGIQNLIDISLVTVDNGNKLMMPQLIQNMGKEILRQDSRDDLHTLSKLLGQLVSSTENTGTETDKGVMNESASHVNSPKRPYSQEFQDNSILPHQSNWKRQFMGIFSLLPSLPKFFFLQNKRCS
ncbi:TMV resistance protein N-like [Ipomoea triloba]|uniref:TMV resistance protein N-like n=1 Tax=Ipomoea triloba TaxID=35885 RepID=UPI00125DBF19|nr:TMV resistance protein N-like [Ipomoea triloba]